MVKFSKTLYQACMDYPEKIDAREFKEIVDKELGKGEHECVAYNAKRFFANNNIDGMDVVSRCWDDCEDCNICSHVLQAIVLKQYSRRISVL